MKRSRGVARWMCVFCCACVTALAPLGCTPVKPADTREPGLDLYVRAIQESRANRPESAITLLEQAVAINPNLRMAHAMLGDAYRARGDFQRASREYEAVTKLDQYTAANHYNLGLTYQLLNKLQEATTAYLRAIALNPKDVKSNMNLGLVYLALGKIDSAVTYLQRAADLDPNNAQVWSNLGVAIDAMGNSADAESRYRRALELDSSNLVTLQNLAQNLISQRRAAEALAIMERVMQRDDSAGAHKRYGDAFALAKEYEHAMSQYDMALKTDPQYLPAMNEKGFTLIQQYIDGLEINDRQRVAALELWKKSLQINPNQPRVIDALRKWENPQLFKN